MDAFRPATRTWFEESFAAPTEVQRRGWAEIARGVHALLVAPTGSGKTLAAFLAGIDAAAGLPADAPDGVRVLYVSPLKALVHDVERNLRAPLAGILRTAERRDEPVRALRVDVRTGDTPQRDRARQARRPAEILVTTPESLYLILGSRARAGLATVETVIVDEIHALAPTKRGAHLALSLERLEELCARPPQRIGLSATVRPLDAIARFLGGDREVAVVDASERPRLALEVRVPVPDMERPPAPARAPGGPILGELARANDSYPGGMAGTSGGERGMWPALYPELLEVVRAHRSTILFVNSRGLCERLAQRLNELAGEELVLAHHGSVSHAERARIEDRLKAGTVRGLVATSSLELGIDMGAVDHVVLVESPGSVARGLQRVGRAGHGVGETSAGSVWPKFRGDLLECAVVAERMLAGEIEALAVPRNPLDVLAQQIVATCCDAPRTAAELERLVRRAYPFAELSTGALHAVLDMLTGRAEAPSELADLRPRLRWDRATDVLSARRGAAMLARLNAGTIPDRGTYGVFLGADGPRVGELDEEMVYESREGDLVTLGATTWRVEEIGRDRVIVSPAPGEPGRLPFWKGDGPGRPVELGTAIGAFVRELGAVAPEQAAAWLRARAPLDALAAANLAAYVAEQRAATGALPTDRAITIERFRDELGDWRVCLLTPFGARVHAPWAMVIEQALAERTGATGQVTWTDDGIVLRVPDADELPRLAELLPDPEEIEERLTRQLGSTSLFASLFRENAVRALLVQRRRPDQRNPLWLQRLKTSGLLAAVRDRPSFPIVLETYRQAMADVFDLDGLRGLLARIRSRAVRVDEVETSSPSPFARSLVFAYVAQYLYDGDSPLAERKAQALTLDRELLRELLGQEELRELLDADVIAALEAELQGLAPERRARDRDELHDLLRRVGDLDATEVAARSAPEGTGDAERVDPEHPEDAALDREAASDPLEAPDSVAAPTEQVEGAPAAVAAPMEQVAGWLEQLAAERRAVAIAVAGTRRWIAAEDAGLYRDALGCAPPSGLPSGFLALVPDGLERLAARFARSRGPFHARELSVRYGLGLARVEPVLRALEGAGRLVRGAIRPGGAELEWCDAEVLRRIKRRTLAKLRGEVAAVDAATFARFLPRWHGLGAGAGGRLGGAHGGPGRLEEAIAQLEGLALPWSALAGELLPERVSGFTLDALDALAARGRVVWVGRGARGPADGLVALYLREHAPLLLEAGTVEGARDAASPDASDPAHARVTATVDAAPALDGPLLEGAVHAALLAHLGSRGASFLTELERAARTACPGVGTVELEAALWDLVWAGRITNDTFTPLRALGRRRSSRRGDALAGGRWSLVRELADADVPETERALARAALLLERYGVVSREAALADALPGGFGPSYRVLRAMEEAGRVRRGWFVEGLSGAQFAAPGAVDRLRAERLELDDPARAPDVRTLAAVDPASPWGALLPWPASASDAARPRRVPGARVVSVDGELVLWIAANRRHLVTFPGALAADPRRLGLALAELPALPAPRRRRLVAIERIDGASAIGGPHAAALTAAGFVTDWRGFVADPARYPSDRAVRE